MVSVLASETVNPNEAHTAMISAIIFARLFFDLETMPTSSAYSIPHIGCGSATTVSWGFISPFLRPRSLTFPPPFSPFTLVHTIPFTTSISALALHYSTATRCTAANQMLNINGASTFPSRRPCPTPNQPKHSPSSVQMRARIPPCEWRTTASIIGGTPNRARVVHNTSTSPVDRIVCLPS